MIEEFDAEISFGGSITKQSLACISKKLHFATGMPLQDVVNDIEQCASRGESYEIHFQETSWFNVYDLMDVFTEHRMKYLIRIITGTQQNDLVISFKSGRKIRKPSSKNRVVVSIAEIRKALGSGQIEAYLTRYAILTGTDRENIRISFASDKKVQAQAPNEHIMVPIEEIRKALSSGKIETFLARYAILDESVPPIVILESAREVIAWMTVP